MRTAINPRARLAGSIEGGVTLRDKAGRAKRLWLYRWIPRIILAIPLIGALAMIPAWYLLSPHWAILELATAARHNRYGDLATMIDGATLCDNFHIDMQSNWDAAHPNVNTAEEAPDAAPANNAGVAAEADKLCQIAPLAAALSGAPIYTLSPSKPIALNAEKTSTPRDGISTFRLHRLKSSTREGDLIFYRQGYKWKLARVQLTRGE